MLQTGVMEVKVFSGALWGREQREQAMEMLLTEVSGTQHTADDLLDVSAQE